MVYKGFTKSRKKKEEGERKRGKREKNIKDQFSSRQYIIEGEMVLTGERRQKTEIKMAGWRGGCLAKQTKGREFQ